MSKHYRCGSHSLALIATTDFDKIIESNSQLSKKHKRALKRCGELWNQKFLARQERLREVLGFELSRPCVVRWNSLQRGIEQIVSVKDKLDSKLYEELGVKNPLTKHDFDYLEDYLKIMTPLAETLDTLQGEKECPYGCLLPNLVSLRNKWKILAGTIRKSLQVVVKRLIASLESRFSDFFEIKGNGRDAAIAATLHPKFKQEWAKGFDERMRTKIRDAVKEAAIQFHQDGNIQLTKNKEAHKNYVFTTGSQSSPEDLFPAYSSEVDSILTNFLQKPCTTDLNAVKEHELIHKMFIRYNTILPSSAPVERLFSYATMTSLPKLNRLTDKNFELRVLCRANMKKASN